MMENLTLSEFQKVKKSKDRTWIILVFLDAIASLEPALSVSQSVSQSGILVQFLFNIQICQVPDILDT